MYVLYINTHTHTHTRELLCIIMSQYAAHLGTVMLTNKDTTGDLFYVQIKGQTTPRLLRDKLEAKEMPSSIKSAVKNINKKYPSTSFFVFLAVSSQKHVLQ